MLVTQSGFRVTLIICQPFAFYFGPLRFKFYYEPHISSNGKLRLDCIIDNFEFPPRNMSDVLFHAVCPHDTVDCDGRHVIASQSSSLWRLDNVRWQMSGVRWQMSDNRCTPNLGHVIFVKSEWFYKKPFLFMTFIFDFLIIGLALTATEWRNLKQKKSISPSLQIINK